MSKFSKGALIFGTCIAIVGLAVAVLASFKTFSLTPVQRDVALNFTVTPEWQEIVPQTPLTVSRSRQTIYLMIDGFDREIVDPGWDIELPDGSVAKPEIQIVDDAGNVYELTSRSWARLPDSLWPNRWAQLVICRRTERTQRSGFAAMLALPVLRSSGTIRIAYKQKQLFARISASNKPTAVFKEF